jgi:hypothetical protein
MVPPRKYRVAISEHARERARERFPGFKAARIMDEVRIALHEGRCSPEKPAGVEGTPRRANLYAWTPNGQRVYALCATESMFHVLTTMKAKP